MNSLEDLGYGPFFSDQFNLLQRPDLAPARISADARGAYHLAGCCAPVGRLSGRLRHELRGVDRPTTGDWVVVADHAERAVIHYPLDRKTVMMRRSAGDATGAQVVAANVDVFFVVTSANRDLSPRRIERYLAAVWQGGAAPVVVLNKVDLATDVDAMVATLASVALAVPVERVSALTGSGLEGLRAHVGPGRTVGLVGSSGVGKSSLINRLVGSDVQPVNSVRVDGKGRHTTTRRELVVLPGGGVLLDTPGMREFGMVGGEDAEGVETAFADVVLLEQQCRFGDCRHDAEPGCAVRGAVASATLSSDRLEGYQKLRDEITASEVRRDPLRAVHSRQRWKTIHKAMRSFTKTSAKRRR